MNEELEIVNGNALEQFHRAEVDMQISTAKRYPRQLSKVKANMLTFATLDQETAESCFYSLPRGGKNIQGPSVRLAEIAVSCYQNLRAGSRVISVEAKGDNPHVTVQAVAHDLENNTSVTIEKRRRIVKKKNKGAVDEDDINLAANAGSAIAFRDAVYKVVPMALIKPVYEAAKKVAIGDARTIKDRRAKAIDLFGKMGISLPRVLAALEKQAVEDIGLADLETLIGLHTAIRDGQTSIDEAFPEPTASELVGKAEEKKPAEDDSNPELIPVKKPAPKAIPVLGDVVTQNGFTFDDYREFWRKEGPPEISCDDWVSFDDVPADWAQRHVKASVGMLKALETMKGGKV